MVSPRQSEVNEDNPNNIKVGLLQFVSYSVLFKELPLYCFFKDTVNH